MFRGRGCLAILLVCSCARLNPSFGDSETEGGGGGLTTGTTEGRTSSAAGTQPAGTTPPGSGTNSGSTGEGKTTGTASDDASATENSSSPEDSSATSGGVATSTTTLGTDDTGLAESSSGGVPRAAILVPIVTSGAIALGGDGPVVTLIGLCTERVDELGSQCEELVPVLRTGAPLADLADVPGWEFLDNVGPIDGLEEEPAAATYADLAARDFEDGFAEAVFDHLPAAAEADSIWWGEDEFGNPFDCNGWTAGGPKVIGRALVEIDETTWLPDSTSCNTDAVVLCLCVTGE